tara:strand:+ start:12978 stop:13091 length:114 start_codon:yes stop_codon:yes gene_type:complete
MVFKSLRQPHNFVVYVGITPTIRESGSSVRGRARNWH